MRSAGRAGVHGVSGARHTGQGETVLVRSSPGQLICRADHSADIDLFGEKLEGRHILRAPIVLYEWNLFTHETGFDLKIMSGFDRLRRRTRLDTECTLLLFAPAIHSVDLITSDTIIAHSVSQVIQIGCKQTL